MIIVKTIIVRGDCSFPHYLYIPFFNSIQIQLLKLGQIGRFNFTSG